MSQTPIIVIDYIRANALLKRKYSDTYSKLWDNETLFHKPFGDIRHIFDNQILVSKTIVLGYILSKLGEPLHMRNTLLVAQMQSGKSGAFANVIYIIMENDWIRRLLNINYILVCTGMSDTELCDQITYDVKFIGGDKYITAFEKLRWNDEELEGKYFAPWKPYTHPTRGEVEIGGWRSNPSCGDRLKEQCNVH